MIDVAVVKERVSLEEAFQLLSLSWPVHSRRRNPVIFCPFEGHEERTPSCTLYLEENRVWCFGCNRGGDVIDLVQLVNGVEFTEALQQLADYANVHETDGSTSRQNLSPRDLFEIVSNQAHEDVLTWTDKKVREHPEMTVEHIDAIFAFYDEILRAERAEEITTKAAIKELLNWRAQWKSRLG